MSKNACNPADLDRHAAGIYSAIAYRTMARLATMRRTAEFYGAEFDCQALDEREAGKRYRADIDTWIWETPTTPAAILALARLIGSISADRLMSEAGDGGCGNADEADALHILVASTHVAEWLDREARDDWLRRHVETEEAGA